MDTFVAYPNNLDFNQGSFHRSSDNYKKVSNFSDIKDFLTLSHTCLLYTYDAADE